MAGFRAVELEPSGQPPFGGTPEVRLRQSLARYQRPGGWRELRKILVGNLLPGQRV